MTNECLHECKQVLHINSFPHFSSGNETKEKQEDLKRKSSNLHIEIAATSINIKTLVLNQQCDKREG